MAVWTESVVLMRDNMHDIKVIIEKHEDGFIAYPLGLKGVVVAQGDTYEEALADVRDVQGLSRDEIDAISRSSVDDAGRAGKLVVRSHVAYLLSVLRKTDGTSTWSAVNIAAALFEHLSRRGVESGLSSNEVDAQLTDWLMPD